MKRNNSLAFVILICAGLAVVSQSCSKKHRNEVYPTHGQVFDKENKPATGALVVFHPIETGERKIVTPVARVDEKGNFNLTTYDKNDGAADGQYIITIEWRLPPKNPMAGNKEGSDRLQGKYSDPKTSKLKFKVEKQPDNVVPTIRLQ
jgi:hypothetical protein